jgi:hypothetical protein
LASQTSTLKAEAAALADQAAAARRAVARARARALAQAAASAADSRAAARAQVKAPRASPVLSAAGKIPQRARAARAMRSKERKAKADRLNKIRAEAQIATALTQTCKIARNRLKARNRTPLANVRLVRKMTVNKVNRAAAAIKIVQTWNPSA